MDNEEKKVAIYPKVVYSNGTNVNRNATDISIDFLTLIPDSPEIMRSGKNENQTVLAQCHTVLLNPLVAKMLLEQLQDELGKFNQEISGS